MDIGDQYRGLFNKWLEERVLDDQERIPAVLWHYTSASALRGILDSQSPWATDTQFLNDAIEIRYGTSMFLRILRQQDLTGRRAETQEFITQIAAADGGIVRTFLDRQLSLFVMCFCAVGDLLSQWRAYGRREDMSVGYALGFASKQPQSWVQVAPGNHGLVLRRVRYDEAAQETACASLIAGLIDLLDTDPSDFDAQAGFARYLVDGLLEFAASSKHPTFSEEQEWRVIYVRTVDADPLPLEFRVANGILVPYVKLELPEPTGARTGRLPVTQVMHGPSSDPVRTRVGLETYLKTLSDGEYMTVTGSLTPLRA